MAAPQFKAVLIATPQMRSESGLTFRSKQSAVWPADPRGRRGGREPAGKTCYLPRFHIMHQPAMLGHGTCWTGNGSTGYLFPRTRSTGRHDHGGLHGSAMGNWELASGLPGPLIRPHPFHLLRWLVIKDGRRKDPTPQRPAAPPGSRVVLDTNILISALLSPQGPPA